MNTLLENFLRQVPVLAGLSPEALALLAGLARAESYGRDTVVIGEGEPGNRVFFVSAGHVSVVKGYGGPRPVELARFGPGDCFGEMSLVESVPRSATVVAEEEVALYSLKGSDLHHLYKELPSQYGILMLNIARELARRVRALDEQLWRAAR